MEINRITIYGKVEFKLTEEINTLRNYRDTLKEIMHDDKIKLNDNQRRVLDNLWKMNDDLISFTKSEE